MKFARQLQEFLPNPREELKNKSEGKQDPCNYGPHNIGIHGSYPGEQLST